MTSQRADNRVGLGRMQFNFAIARDRDEFSGRRVSDGIDRFARWYFRLDPRHREFLGFELRRRFGPGVNPGPDECDLFRFEFLALFSRRHDQLFAVLFKPALDQPHEQALLAFAGNNHRAALAALHQQIEALHDQFGFRILRPVAFKAMLSEDRVHGRVIVRRRRFRRRPRRAAYSCTRKARQGLGDQPRRAQLRRTTSELRQPTADGAVRLDQTPPRR